MGFFDWLDPPQKHKRRKKLRTPGGRTAWSYYEIVWDGPAGKQSTGVARHGLAEARIAQREARAKGRKNVTIYYVKRVGDEHVWKRVH